MGTYYTDIAISDPVIASTFNDRFDELDTAIGRVLGSGTSFPILPAEGDRFWRTDLNLLFIYSGAAWFVAHIGSAFAANKNGTSQTAIVTATPTKITFTTQLYDLLSDYDAANSRWTPAIKGIAVVTCNMRWATTPDQAVYTLYLYKNGSAIRSQIFVSASTAPGSCFGTWHTEVDGASDYLEIYGEQASGSNKDITGTTTITNLSGFVIPTV